RPHFVYFMHGPPTSQTYTLSLHDALPILRDERDRHAALPDDLAVVEHELPGDAAQQRRLAGAVAADQRDPLAGVDREVGAVEQRSEEHTSELQSRENLVCRLLLEKKKNS